MPRFPTVFLYRSLIEHSRKNWGSSTSACQNTDQDTRECEQRPGTEGDSSTKASTITAIHASCTPEGFVPLPRITLRSREAATA